MIELRVRTKDDYPYLFPIVRSNEPFCENVTFEQMSNTFDRGEGWTVLDTGIDTTIYHNIIGYVGLTEFRPLHSVTLHVTVDSSYHSKCITRKGLRKVFHYLFHPDGLDLKKVYSYAIVDVTYTAAKALDDVGFKVEGIDRMGWQALNGECYDMLRYGMLKEECPWIKNMKEDPVSGWLAITRKIKGLR